MSLQISNEALAKLNQQYDGIHDQIFEFEAMTLPVCSKCGTDNTAVTQVGVIGRTMNIALATSKVKIVANGESREGQHYCNSCEVFFDSSGCQ